MNVSPRELRHLFPPFSSIEETVFAWPPALSIQCMAREMQVLYFFSRNLSVICDETVCEVEEGDLVLLKRTPYCLKRSGGSSTRGHLLRIAFDTGSLPYEQPPSEWETMRSFKGPLLKMSGTSAISALVYELRETGEDLGDRESTLGMLKIQALGMAIIQEIDARVGRKAEKGLCIVNDVHRFLIRNVARKDLSLDEIAWHFNFSGDYLNRLYRNVTGSTLFQELHRIRIHKAKSLLLEMEQSLTDIASEVGYASASSFCHAFRKAVGCPPHDYRSRYQGMAFYGMA